MLSSVVHNLCGEGACSRWRPKDSRSPDPDNRVLVAKTRFSGFTTAAQPSGSKLPRHKGTG